jgi:hypothetical protein
MLKHIFLSSFILFSVVSCTEVQNKEDIEKTDTTQPELTQKEIELNYENSWKILKLAITDKNKDVVMTFVSNEDILLKEAIDISYEYIFDDEMIEFITDKSYQDFITVDKTNSVIQNESTSIVENKRIIHFEKAYNLYLDTASASISSNGVYSVEYIPSEAKSGISIELSEINQSIKITNFNTFHNVIDN